jgi:hypothetical protein
MFKQSLEEQPGAAPSHEYLYFRTPKGEPVQYEVACIPAIEGDVAYNWTTDLLSTADSAVRQGYGERLRQELPAFVTEAYAPSSDAMSGIILAPERFTNHVKAHRQLTVRCPGFHGSTGKPLPCEGTDVKRNSALILSPGGCAFVVLSGVTPGGEELCVMAHAGRESLLDKHEIMHGVHSRSHFSVIDALVGYARK